MFIPSHILSTCWCCTFFLLTLPSSCICHVQVCTVHDILSVMLSVIFMYVHVSPSERSPNLIDFGNEKGSHDDGPSTDFDVKECNDD